MPGQYVDRVSAVGPERASTTLIHERVISNCSNARRSYRLAETLLALCDDTCAQLRNEGFDALEVRLECNR